MEKIQMVDLRAQYAEAVEHRELLPRPAELLASGQYIGGPFVTEFEEAWAAYNDVSYAVGTSSGTSALTACFMAILDRWRSSKAKVEGRRIRIITQANTFVATANAALRIPDLEVVFVDCDEYFGMDVISLQRALDDEPEKWDVTIVVPVHMYGIMCDMQAILALVNQRANVFLVEDASHAHGSEDIQGRKAGSYGDLAAFSLFPAKPLGAAGDAGVVITHQAYYADYVRSYCNVGRSVNYGTVDWDEYENVGFTYRLDTIQALILRAKLRCLDDWRSRREQRADDYYEQLNANFFQPPAMRATMQSCAWYAFPLRVDHHRRESLTRHLFEQGIPCKKYYPKVISDVGCMLHNPRVSTHGYLPIARRCCDEVLCIPLHENLHPLQQGFIIEQINDTDAWI